MREIKFRAWDKEYNKMWFMGQEGESIGDWTFQTYFNKKGCFEAVIFRCFDNGAGLENKDIKLPIMQYTGLKDKNGKEIYEGDILKEQITKESIYPEENIFYVVIFNDGMFTTKTLYLNYNSLSGIDCMGISGKNKTSEVIGNIYENPELLKG